MDNEKVEFEEIEDEKTVKQHNVTISDDDNSATQKVTKSDAEKRFVRKLNNNILPLIFFIILCQFCDKSVLSVAAVLGIRQDTNITLSQYNWVGSIFYLGYLICQVANAYLIQKFRISRYLGTALILWGITVGATAACNNYSQLLACRFLLGLFEGVTYPCVYITLNTLYRRSEQSLVWGFIGIGTGGGTVIGVLIAYGFSHMDGLNGWRAWRWGYIICGILTVIVGICTLLFMVDDPHHKLLKLTEEEKLIVEERTRDNCVVRIEEIKISQIIEALKEPRLYLTFVFSVLNCLQNGGIVTYATILVENLGFTSLMSIILQIPNGAAAAIFSIGAVAVAHRIHKVTLVGLCTTVIAALGFILMIVTPGKAKLLGFYLTWAMVGSSSIQQTIVTTNVSGYTKKVFYNNIMMVGNTIGNFGGPLVMVESDAPQYVRAMIGFIITNVGSFFIFALYFYVMNKENKRRRANLGNNPPTDVHLDLTDVQDKNFIYRL